MSLTLEEVKSRLNQLSEIDLLEILDITSEDLTDRFEDKIEERLDYFITDLGSDEWEMD